MAVVRFYTGQDGQTHFEELETHSRDRSGNPITLRPAEHIALRRYEEGHDVPPDWHNAPRRQFIVVLSGQTEIEIGDGTRRRFGIGDTLLMEDTTGQGHITRHFGDFCAAVVPIATENG